MVRILQSVNIMDRAGLETMLMNYYRNMDCSKIQFDFLTHRGDIGAYEEEIKSMGGNVFHAPRLYPKYYIKYFEYMKTFFENHPEYLIIHSHIDSMSFFPLLAAKDNGVQIRIGHSHSSKLDKDFKFLIKYIALKMMPKVANVHFACGDIAGRFMYPKGDFTIIHNAIDLECFSFNEQLRKEVREKLNLQNQFVIGHVGRYCYIKNQLFLLDIFNEILRKRPDSALVLVGKGEDEQKIREKARELGIDDKIILLIDRGDVRELYQAFDIFVMPSIFEGLPVVGVEAQANGLPCVFSDNISHEVILTSNASYLRLDSGARDWAWRILNTNICRNENATTELKEKGYDIKIEAKKLQDWYLSVYHKMEEGETG